MKKVRDGNHKKKEKIDQDDMHHLRDLNPSSRWWQSCRGQEVGVVAVLMAMGQAGLRERRSTLSLREKASFCARGH